jgi:peptidyl-prolyl cis-trans isomerase C
MKRSFYLLTILVILFSACHLFERAEDRVVITVGSRGITEDELKKAIQQIIFEMEISDREAKEGIETIVNRVIERAMIMEYGKEEGIGISDDELESAVKDIKRDYPEDVFKEMLLRRYIDIEEWKEGFREELLIKKIVTKVTAGISPVTFDETKEYFNTHRDEFRRPAMVQLRQIVVPTREEALKILQRLKEGEEMGELAGKYSITPEAKDGGILGWIDRGQLEESMESAIFSLRVGEISDIFKSPYGYHIFEVISARDAGLQDLPEAMAEIESRLMLQKKESFYREWIKELRDRYPVKIKQEINEDWIMEG